MNAGDRPGDHQVLDLAGAHEDGEARCVQMSRHARGRRPRRPSPCGVRKAPLGPSPCRSTRTCRTPVGGLAKTLRLSSTLSVVSLQLWRRCCLTASPRRSVRRGSPCVTGDGALGVSGVPARASRLRLPSPRSRRPAIGTVLVRWFRVAPEPALGSSATVGGWNVFSLSVRSGRWRQAIPGLPGLTAAAGTPDAAERATIAPRSAG